MHQSGNSTKKIFDLSQIRNATIAFFTIELTGNKAACCSACERALKNYLA
jgi:hypothetical protein